MGMSYTDMLIALSNGKYSAAQIAEVCTQYNITPEQLYTDLYGNENLTFLKTKNGTTTLRGVSTTEYGGFYGGATTSGERAALELENTLNSNTAGVTTKTAVKTRIPVSSTLNSAGKVNFNTELAHVGGQTIAGTETLSLQTVGLALAAAGIGISAGKAIDSALYNLNPDFWDEHNLSTLNPQTWGTMTADIDEDNPLYLRWGGAAFDAIFGTNAETGQTQMYLTEEQIAYIMGYMIQQGVFDSGGTVYPPSPTEGSYTVSSIGSLRDLIDSVCVNQYVADGIYNDAITHGWPETGAYSISKDLSVPTSSAWNLVLWYNPNIQLNTVISNVNASASVQALRANYNNAGDASTSYFSRYTAFENANREYYRFIGEGSTYLGTVGATAGGGGVDGITNQDGATQFNASGISDPTDLSNVLAALKTQFPSWFDTSKGIRQEVIDENGNTMNIDYYPVAIPDFTPDNVTQPTGGTDNATQSDPSVNPDLWSESLIQTIAQMLMQGPVTDETDTVNPPETGDGNTPIVTPPTGSATALWSIYNPTQAQVDSFGAWLWSNDFVDQLKKIFNDPMESIISLHKVFGTPATGSTQNIAVGYLNSGVSSKIVTAQYTDVDCGSIQLSEYFGNVYDYKDTSVELYLPFIGIVPLSVSDVMRASIHIVYHIDVLTGACLADVEVIRDAGAGGVLYQYSGDCAVHYPVSSGSYIGIVGGILSAGAGIAGTIASGGAAAPLVLGGASALMRMHTDVARSGGFSANAGAMGAKVPYLIISRPQTALPENYLDIEGIGSNKTVTLNTCSGYTRIKEVYLQGIGDATEGELNELETLLKAGVIFPITETPTND